MSAIEASIHTALEQHLRAFAEPRGLRVARQGYDFTPPDGEYLRSSFMPNRTTNPWTAFSDPSVFQGIFQITVVWPAGGGVDPALTLAADIANHFGRGTRIPAADPPMTIEERPSIASPLQDASSLEVPISIRYRLIR
ncbi:DUF4128 domain-containing protein [Aureimonas populi]|uniref:DUF4128 domain-containing protein n=1 Tax=Aureimonas populi TaxID=1701758 RepID=A0ABW5CFB3_9HYPH|nr:DUF4128 domain-containing protein [Aureimonas populi]